MKKEDAAEMDDSKVLLDERMLETPGIALQSVVSEVCRMGKIVTETMHKSKTVMFTQDYQDILDIKEEENIVDGLCGGLPIM